jgi:hypothetical protein
MVRSSRKRASRTMRPAAILRDARLSALLRMRLRRMGPPLCPYLRPLVYFRSVMVRADAADSRPSFPCAIGPDDPIKRTVRGRSAPYRRQ